MKYRQKNGKFITKKQHEFMPKLIGQVLVAFALAVVVNICTQEAFKALNSPSTFDYVAKMILPTAKAFPIVPERAVENDLTWKLWTLSGGDWDVFGDMYDTITCESHWIAKQSDLHYKNGGREKSYGIAQIHLPAHPWITKAEAMDKDFSINFIVDEFKAGHQCKWSCYKLNNPSKCK
jgi:hypothetical protein